MRWKWTATRCAEEGMEKLRKVKIKERALETKEREQKRNKRRLKRRANRGNRQRSLKVHRRPQPAGLYAQEQNVQGRNG